MSTEAQKNGSAEQASEGIVLERVGLETFQIPIVGVTPLIMHKWSEKALQMMRDKQSGKKSRKKLDPKDPAEEAEAATYRLEDGSPGMPATAFKAAIVGAARLFDGLTLVETKQLIFVEGEGPDQLVKIDGEYTIREDTPRIGQGTTDLRYRPCFPDWTAELRVSFLPSKIDPESVINLVDAAGLGGVGEWRPSAPKSLTGTFGRFQTDPDKISKIL